MIVFKYPEKQREIELLPNLLLEILEVYEFLACKITGNNVITVTEIYRDALHDGDLHTIYRALDVGILAKGGINASQRMREIINNIYLYDPLRPAMQVIVDLNHGSAPHTHIQIHNRTTKKGKWV